MLACVLALFLRIIKTRYKHNYGDFTLFLYFFVFFSSMNENTHKRAHTYEWKKNMYKCNEGKKVNVEVESGKGRK